MIAADFDERPGLRLTFPQIRNKWGLSVGECQNIVKYLVSTGDLLCDGERYGRPDGGSSA
jgi:hypothetical protein